MDTTEDAMRRVHQAVAGLERAEQEVKDARAQLGLAIADALTAGVRPRDIEPEVPYKREHIRRIAREHGVPPLREATVVRKADTDS